MSNSRQRLRIVTLLENNLFPHDPRVRPHMEALAAAGYDVTVIAPRAPGQPRSETIHCVRVWRFWLPASHGGAASYVSEYLYATLAMTWLALWVWLRQGLDVLHLYNPPDCLFVAALLPKLAGKIIVYDLRDLSPELYQSKFSPANPMLHQLLLWLERRSCRLADRIIVVNNAYRQIVLERDGVPPERVSVVRQGPDLGRIQATQPDPGLRARAGTIIGYLGNMARQDGVDHLLRALRHLDQCFGQKDWFCALIGPADDQQQLENLAAELGLSSRVWFTGYLPYEQWVPLLSAVDIGVEPAPANPLNNVSTMNKLMDYMALAKPSIAYALPEHYVTAAEAALYARPNDEVDLARQMARLIAEPALRAQLGAIGRQRIEQHLAWQHQRERLLSVYASLACLRTAAAAARQT